MSRSGYSDDCENLGLYRGTVERAIAGKRGQAFLRELAEALDAMPVKELIAEELVTDDGQCCTMGVVCKNRGLDVSKIDPTDPKAVGSMIGIAHQLAAEIAYENDETGQYAHYDEQARRFIAETPAERWTRMRAWVAKRLLA